MSGSSGEEAPSAARKELSMYTVVWCKDCPATGVIPTPRLTDPAVAWANAHAEVSGHRRIASLSFEKLRDLYQTAVEAVNRDQYSTDFKDLV